MHHSRLSTFVLDCKVDDLETAAAFWSQALGRAILPAEPDVLRAPAAARPARRQAERQALAVSRAW